MFSRFKGLNLDFLDNKIAEEQEKQKQQQQQKGPTPAKRTPSNAGRRGSGRTASPSKRAGSSRLQVPDGRGGDGASKGPDPDDFVIGDDASDAPSRSTTPVPVKGDGDAAPADAKDEGGKEGVTTADKGKGQQAVGEDELPEDVRNRLAKLDRLTAKYQDLLRNYRNAHAHVAAIEPFEATLREHTPLTSISDPGALVEYLNQRGLQTDMAMQELKRVSSEHHEAVKERDELKTKLEEAEKKAKEAFDEAAGLRNERKEAGSTASNKDTSDPLGASEINQDSSTSKAKSDDDMFFSYEDEVSRAKAEEDEESSKKVDEVKSEYKKRVAELQEEMKERQDYINELSTENASMREDLESMRRELETTRLNLHAMENKHDVRDRNDTDIKAELVTLKERLEKANIDRSSAEGKEQETAASLARAESEVVNLQDRLKGHDESTKKLQEKAETAEKDLKKYQDEHEQNVKSGKYVQRDEKGLENLRKLVKTLQDQVKEAGEAKTATERKFNDMQLEINRLESESDTNANTIRHLRQSEAATNSLKKRLAEAEEDREKAQKLADTKTGHEAKVASLSSQLKRTQKDYDELYQIILDCGKCSVPDADTERSVATPTDPSSTPESRSRMGSEHKEVDTQPTDASNELPTTPSVEGGELAPPGDAKKKNKKKKSKSKKKATGEEAASTSTEKAEVPAEDMLRNPEVLKAKFGDNPLMPLLLRTVETMKERNESDGTEHETLRLHLESLNEDLQQKIRDSEVVLRAKADRIMELEQSVAKDAASTEGSVEQEKQIESLKKEIAELKEQMSEKDAQISKLQERLQGESVLQEKIDDLTEEKNSAIDDMAEHGRAFTGVKNEVKDLKESREKLQQEFDELQAESDGYLKKMRDAEARKDMFSTRSRDLETEIQQLKTRTVSSDEMEGLKEQLQSANKEKESLKVLKEACEKQIEELKMQHSATGVEAASKHKSLSAEFDTLRSKTTELEKELAAANDLAQTRFKDLTAIREQYNKVQPELKRLREESAELKTVKVELEKASASIKKLEAKEKDLRSEIAEYKSQNTAKDTEIASLREKCKKSDERSSALEDSYETARKDLEKSEKTRDDTIETRERLEATIKKLEDEVRKSKANLDELDSKAKKASAEAASLREDLELKTGQQASAQSLMDSIQDGNRELATQMKETKQRCESLEEELEDAQRLLSERSREGEKMRRLLAEAEGRAETAVKEMRERMDLAIEERDRAEDEASTIGRRKAREIEDLKTKLRDAEREANRATEAKQDAERRERDFKSRQDELERRASQAQEEINEVRTAMAQLRDTLDETERQSHELEKQKLELRKMVDEKDARLERLTKSSKTMAEELRAIQAAKKQAGSSTPSRSSLDSNRVTSPAPRASNGSAGQKDSGGIDYVYLKNVLLQFMETKEKKHQMQFVPVLRMLLHFTPEEEQKWQAVVSAK